MALSKFINLLAISSLAVFACSFGATPVSALATDNHHVRDIPGQGHVAIARRKRAVPNNVKRCKQRPSTATTSSPHHISTLKKSDPKPKPAEPKSSSTKHSSSKPTPTSTPPSSGGGKVGLAWPNGDSLALNSWVTKKVQYIYTWGPQIPAGAKKDGLKIMPMLWGENQISEFTKLVKRGYADCVMGPNEVNEKHQANMSPTRGAQVWIQYIEPLKNEGYTKLLAPSTSSNPNGKTWMQDWYKACKGKCNPTHHTVHYYDVSAEGFIAYMKLWHDTFKKPIVPTEFACQNFNGGPQCSKSQVDSFMSQSITFMDKTDWVDSYFAFGVMKDMQGVNALDQLMDSQGKPNALGKKYIDDTW